MLTNLYIYSIKTPFQQQFVYLCEWNGSYACIKAHKQASTWNWLVFISIWQVSGGQTVYYPVTYQFYKFGMKRFVHSFNTQKYIVLTPGSLILIDKLKALTTKDGYRCICCVIHNVYNVWWLCGVSFSHLCIWAGTKIYNVGSMCFYSVE